MNHRAKLVPLTLAHRWWGLAPETVRAWAVQDGATIHPSAWGAAIARRDLRETLSRRAIPVPAGLEEWPRVLVAVEGMAALKLVFDTLDEAYPDGAVKLASDGAHALRELDSFRPHLLIADMTSERFDGAELCRQARFCPASPSTRIVALGPNETQSMILVKAGNAECLPAPARISGEQLASSCARVLAGKPQVGEVDRSSGLARLFVWR